MKNVNQNILAPFLGMFCLLKLNLETEIDKTEDKSKRFLSIQLWFYLNLNQFDYKLVLDPKIWNGRQKILFKTNLLTVWSWFNWENERLNDNFDLRIEPGLQFVERVLLLIHNQTTNMLQTNNPFTPKHS